MPRLARSRDYAAGVGEAEELYLDLERWPAWVEGLARVSGVHGEWPRPGAEVCWVSGPGGRGTVRERVTAREPGRSLTLEVTDERLVGTQGVAFTELDGGVEVTLELDYRLVATGPLTPVVDLLFIRRALGDSLARTLERFGRELEAFS